MNHKSYIHFLKYGFLLMVVLFVVYPLVFTFFTSLKTREGYITNPIGVTFSQLTLNNYVRILFNFNFLPKLMNMALVVIGSSLLIFFLGIPAAYALHGLSRKRLANDLLILLFVFMFVPEEVLILPEYNLMSSLGLINHFFSVILIFTASSLPEVIFMLYIFFQLVPKEVLDAARLDGANDFAQLTGIVIPLSKSPILVVFITTVISLWNTFLVPMLMIYEEEKKLLLPSLSGLITKHSTTPTYQMAGTFLSMIPLIIMYMTFKRQIFENSLGGVIQS